MLKIRMNTEDWRELITGWIADDASDAEVDDLADELRDAVLARLNDYEPAYTQSVGAFAIVQAGTPIERAAFDAAVDAEVAILRAAHA